MALGGLSAFWQPAFGQWSVLFVFRGFEYYNFSPEGSPDKVTEKNRPLVKNFICRFKFSLHIWK